MNKRFQTLPEEKQLAIMRAATEVFAKYEYKKASTDLIASKAGVSKGLLFYYFHNKRDLYLTVYEYAEQIITKEVADDLKKKINEGSQQKYAQYFSNIEFGKFKDDVNPAEIFQMFIWLTDGYIHEHQMRNEPLRLDEIGKAFANWTELFKRIAYREEYL